MASSDSHNTRSVAELQAQLRRTPENGVVEIADVGEYEGPLVIDRPLTLAGQGGLTPVWSRDTPTVLITSPNVTLRRLWLQVTTDPTVLPVICAPGCEPQLIETNLEVNQMMTTPNIINLGKLSPGDQFIVRFEVDSEFPYASFQHRQSGKPLPAYLHPTKAQAPAPDVRVFQFEVNVNQDEGYLFDEIEFMPKDNTQATPYKVYVMGLISKHERPNALGEVAIQAEKRGQKPYTMYFLGDNLEITSEHLGLIAGNNTRSTRYFQILKTASGRRFVWLPNHDEGRQVRVGDRSVYAWTKKDINYGDVIALPGTDIGLTVVEPQAHALTISNPLIDFSNMTRVEERYTLNLKRDAKGLGRIIPGRSTTYTVRSLVPWLEAPPLVDVRGDTQLQIGLTRAIFNLPANEEYTAQSALALQDTNGHEIYVLPAKIRVVLDTHAFKVRESSITFVSDDPIYAEEIPNLTASFTINNVGREPLTFSIQQKPEWLGVARAITDPLLPGDTVNYPVQLSGEKANPLFRAGTNQETLTLLCTENGQTVDIPLEVSVAPARVPLMTFTKPARKITKQRVIDLDDLRIPDMTKPGRRLAIQNEGVRPGYYRVRMSHACRLFINPEEEAKRMVVENPEDYIGELGPTQTQIDAFRLHESALEGLQPGDRLAIQIVLETSKDGQTFYETDKDELVYDVVNRQPLLELSPPSSDLGDVVEGKLEPTALSLSVTNGGQKKFEGHVSYDTGYHPHIKLPAEAEHLSLEPGQTTKLQVRVATSLSTSLPTEREWSIPLYFIRKDTNDQSATYTIRMNLRSATPRPHLQTKSLWFGVVEVEHDKRANTLRPLSEKRPTQTLVLGNYGSAPWEVQVAHMADWLESDVPLQAKTVLTIPEERILRLPIRIAEGFFAEVGNLNRPYREDNALVLESVNTDDEIPPLTARVQLSEAVPRIFAAPNPVMLGYFTEDQPYPAQQEVELRNESKVSWQPSTQETKTLRDGDYIELAQPLPHVIRAGESARIVIRWRIQDKPIRLSRSALVEDAIYIGDRDGNGVEIYVNYEVHPGALGLSPKVVKVVSATPTSMANPATTSATRFTKRKATSKSHTPQSTGPDTVSDNVWTITNTGQAPFALVETQTDPSGATVLRGNLVMPHGLKLTPLTKDDNPYVIPPGEKRQFRVELVPGVNLTGSFSIVVNLTADGKRQLMQEVQIVAG